MISIYGNVRRGENWAGFDLILRVSWHLWLKERQVGCEDRRRTDDDAKNKSPTCFSDIQLLG